MEVDMITNELLTVRECTKILRVTHQTVLKLIKEKELKATKIGREFRIKRSDLQKLIDGK